MAERTAVNESQSAEWKKYLRKMMMIRAFEDKVFELLARDVLKGASHVYAGEEAVAVGACAAIGPDDFITSTHRGHGHCVARGGELKYMLAELCGKATGYCKGKGGSMHIADVSAGNLGANGVVGGGIPLATGAGLTCKMKRPGAMTLCFFGDGAANQGGFHESLNLASIWDLPVVFICENNVYGMSFHFKKAIRAESIAARSVAYGIPGAQINGNDALAVYQAVGEAVERARAGEGPTLIECRTYRWKGHSKSDAQLYRTKEEVEEWKSRCPICSLADRMIEWNMLTEEELNGIREQTAQDIEDAARFAEDSPEPDLPSALEDVYA